MLLGELQDTLELHILNFLTPVEFLFATAFVDGKRRFMLTLNVITRAPFPEHRELFG